MTDIEPQVELIGYIGRALSSQESPNWTLGPYIIQSLLLLLAPAFFAASIYMVLARIIILTDGNSHSIIKVRWITKIFVAGDVLSFLAQSSGGGLLAKAKSRDDAKMGEKYVQYIHNLLLQRKTHSVDQRLTSVSQCHCRRPRNSNPRFRLLHRRFRNLQPADTRRPYSTFTIRPRTLATAPPRAIPR